MKLLFITIALLTSTVLYSQVQKLHAVQVVAGIYSSKDKSWINDDPVYTYMPISFNETTVWIADRAHSVYHLVRKVSADRQATCWSAVDEKNRSCTIKLSIEDGDLLISVYYQKATIRYVYIIDKSEW